MISELIGLAANYGGIGGGVISLGVLGYLVYSKKRESDTEQLPLQAEIVKITQKQQSIFFDKQNIQTQELLDTQKKHYESWTELLSKKIDDQSREIKDQSKELQAHKEEITRLRNKMDELHKDIIRRDKRLSEQESIINEKNLEISRLKKLLKEKELLVADLEQQIRESKGGE